MRRFFPGAKLPGIAWHQNRNDAAMCRKMRRQAAETPIFRVLRRGHLPVQPDPGRTARFGPWRGGEVRPHGGRRGGPLLQTGGAGAAFHRLGDGCLGSVAFVSRLPSHPRGSRGVVARGSLGAVCGLPARGTDDRRYGCLRVHNFAARRLPGSPSPRPLQGLRAGEQAADDPTLPARW